MFTAEIRQGIYVSVKFCLRDDVRKMFLGTPLGVDRENYWLGLRWESAERKYLTGLLFKRIISSHLRDDKHDSGYIGIGRPI